MSTEPNAPVTALSVLDLIPVRSDQTSSQALRASTRLAQAADELGFRRYWVAEHHNMPAVASTNPAVLIALLASATRQITVGSGGVMLPNHAPLVIAEQFALLEAAFPGRVDLGLGRAPGSDPVTSHMLRSGSARGGDGVDSFPDDVRDVVDLMSPGGLTLDLRGRTYPLSATPRATSVPDVWLLGSSMYSAQLAAALGLPYVFAHHFAGQGTAEAMATYRSTYRPSEAYPAPKTFAIINTVVAESAEEAERRALPYTRSMIRLRTGGEMGPVELIEDAEAAGLAPEHAGLAQQIRSTWAVGTPDVAARQVRALAELVGTDEVMLSPVGSAHVGENPETATTREDTLRLLAAELL
ncbi:luciferase family oxidoreductase, group 1 [Sanguibacter gelidistatuariae]|uniref:Luciferase family oxidoreductase, group 1 n=1 Tax=Sanguibacter gelidistatuariae TaxID=1814289 RepID=A0A1G6H232_9MICO|nr:LLM class flavin-dependent oxidoreductase [Sanguibacter gelidistatuariae]SDB88329.1 luciferase family oxidoreductase, group 1 [Sanguibacter gelidistatuariae]